MNLLYIKALHIIFVVTWFAGLFYIWRLFVNFVEAGEKEEPAKTILQDQFKIMMSRLWYGITWPSAVIACFMGLYLMWSMYRWAFIQQPWLNLKLSFVFLLLIYHSYTHIVHNNLQRNISTLSSMRLRLMNELASVFLVAIVFIVVLKDTLSWVWGLVGLLILVATLLVAIKVYKKYRAKSLEKNAKA